MASEFVDVETKGTEVREVEVEAAEWGLTREDALRYRELMRGRRGVWSPEADPLLVLGAHARSDSERRRFAEAFVRLEFERVQGELAFERAVGAAWKRLFPGELRLALSTAAGTVERYALLFGRDCSSCGGQVRAYARRGVPVDVYVRGAETDADLRAWVRENDVDAEEIVAGRLTVNHAGRGWSGGGVWKKEAGGRWVIVE